MQIPCPYRLLFHISDIDYWVMANDQLNNHGNLTWYPRAFVLPLLLTMQFYNVQRTGLEKGWKRDFHVIQWNA